MESSRGLAASVAALAGVVATAITVLLLTGAPSDFGDWPPAPAPQSVEPGEQENGTPGEGDALRARTPSSGQPAAPATAPTDGGDPGETLEDGETLAQVRPDGPGAVAPQPPPVLGTPPAPGGEEQPPAEPVPPAPEPGEEPEPEPEPGRPEPEPEPTFPGKPGPSEPEEPEEPEHPEHPGKPEPEEPEPSHPGPVEPPPEEPEPELPEEPNGPKPEEPEVPAPEDPDCPGD